MTPWRASWLLVALLWVVAMLNYLDRQVVFALFPPLEKDLGLSSVQLGLLGTVFLWVYGVASPFSGWLADRFSRRAVILASLAVWSAVTWATGAARNFTELAAARALMGISEACYLPAALALIADHHGDRTRSLATGLHQSGLYAGIALGGLAGGWIGEHYGWRAAFTVLGWAGIAYAIVLATGFKAIPAAPRAPVSERPPMLPAVRELLALPGFLTMTAVQTLASIAYWMTYTWLPLFIYEKFRLSLTSAGFTATFYLQAASAAGIVVGGALADRWTRRSARGRILTQVMGLSAAAPALFLSGTAPGVAWLLPCLVVFGLGRGFFDCNVMPVLARIARPELRATGYGVFNFASCLAGGLMALAAGAVKDTLGLGFALQVSGFILAVAALLLLRLR